MFQNVVHYDGVEAIRRVLLFLQTAQFDLQSLAARAAHSPLVEIDALDDPAEVTHGLHRAAAAASDVK